MGGQADRAVVEPAVGKASEGPDVRREVCRRPASVRNTASPIRVGGWTQARGRGLGQGGRRPVVGD